MNLTVILFAVLWNSESASTLEVEVNGVSIPSFEATTQSSTLGYNNVRELVKFTWSAKGISDRDFANSLVEKLYDNPGNVLLCDKSENPPLYYFMTDVEKSSLPSLPAIQKGGLTEFTALCFVREKFSEPTHSPFRRQYPPKA